MTHTERLIRRAIAWKLAAVGDAITGLAHRILDEIPTVDTMSVDSFDGGSTSRRAHGLEPAHDFVQLGYDAGVHAGLSAQGAETGR